MGLSALSAAVAGIELLQRSLERGRLGHAYLFSGDNLDPLELAARTLAKTLNCQKPVRHGESAVAVDCCDCCPACLRIDADNHPDVRWVRPESKTRVITVAQMRELITSVSMKGGEGAWKVATIVAADRLNPQAANSFLKTLEEPPPRSTLILLTRDPQKLLETILSRCLRLHLTVKAPTAGAGAHDEWLGQFARRVVEAKGGALERYRLLGQLLARLGAMREAIEKELTRKSPLETHDDIEPALKQRWVDELAAAIEAEYRRQRGELLEALQGWLRDVWLISLHMESLATFHPGLGEVTREVGCRVGPRSAIKNLAVMEDTQKLLTTNIQEALALEVGLLKLNF